MANRTVLNVTDGVTLRGVKGQGLRVQYLENS